ncbi:hypothetical protein EUTSA_v10005695mg [Eutrema salsugineum]|uniref:TF-B3 domain-containing protein n=1 Tax=Eutrema salsugineum TaxID=72664 RepID=V4K3W9_EUTSA|nr:B3 domain-containing protein At5g26805 [Eutrema salsugineum]ESQ32195.1 hypothetical protein EUTSA_v10005695mg [Eutrema salsugineum]
MIKTLFYTFLQTKDEEDNANSTDFNHPLCPQEIEIRPITHSPWEIIRTLSIDEVWTGGKFQFPLEQIWNAMLRHQPRDVMPLTNVMIGSFQIPVNDLDTNTFHSVTLWKYPHENTFAMRESWIEEFVKRRRLVAGMVVGMYWDFDAHMLCFSVLEGSE